MDRNGLLRNPLPIDRVAARVTGVARPESLWRPMPRHIPGGPRLGDVLEVVPIPRSAVLSNPRIAEIVGVRRDRMTVIGYAKQQGSPTAPAKWVARCSCGNHEYRTRILRWVSTKAPDSCRECRHRDYILSKGKEERDPAVRLTIIAAKQGAQW